MVNFIRDKLCLNSVLCGIAAAALSSLPISNLEAMSQEKAQELSKRLFERFNSIPPDRETLAAMMNHISAGRTDQAAFLAIDHSSRNFYKLFLVDMWNSLSNFDGLREQELNEFSATVVGMTRDNIPFDQILYGDNIYTGPDRYSQYIIRFTSGSDTIVREVNRDASEMSGYEDWSAMTKNRDSDASSEEGDNPEPSDYYVRPLLRTSGSLQEWDENVHYDQLQSRKPDTWVDDIVRRDLNELHELLNGVRSMSAEDRAGLFAMRTPGRSIYNAGTNRRPIPYVMETFLCRSLEQLHDTTAPGNKIRQDIDRSPAGSSQVFKSQCSGCHAGMDAMATAFAYVDWDDNSSGSDTGELRWSSDLQSTNKQYRQDTVYPPGFRVSDNRWENHWNEGQNVVLGWNRPSDGSSIESGVGIKSLAKSLAATDAFAQCMTKRAYENVCLKDPTPNEESILNSIAEAYKSGMGEYSDLSASGKYNMRALYARVSSMCFGD